MRDWGKTAFSTGKERVRGGDTTVIADRRGDQWGTSAAVARYLRAQVSEGSTCLELSQALPHSYRRSLSWGSAASEEAQEVPGQTALIAAVFLVAVIGITLMLGILIGSKRRKWHLSHKWLWDIDFIFQGLGARSCLVSRTERVCLPQKACAWCV